MSIFHDKVRIEGFPDGLWRLNCLGAVRKHRANSDDYEVELHFSRVVNRQASVLSKEYIGADWGRESESLTNVWTAIGNFPLLKPGSLWQHGYPLAHQQTWDDKEIRTYKLDASEQASECRSLRSILHQSVRFLPPDIPDV